MNYFSSFKIFHSKFKIGEHINFTHSNHFIGYSTPFV